MADDKSSRLDDIGYQYVARPMYRLGEKLSRETSDQSAKRYDEAADRIESGRAMVKRSDWPRRRAKELRSKNRSSSRGRSR